jgi:hypothetical protein
MEKGGYIMNEQPPTPPQQQAQAKKSKKWVWIVGAIVVLVIIIAVASSAGSKKDKSGETSEQTSMVTQEKTGSMISANVGEPVSIDDLTITVYSFTWSAGGDYSFQKPDAGNKFLVADIGFVNNDTKPRMLAQVYQTKVHTPEGYDYDVTLDYFPEPSLTSDEVAPGQKARGYVCFEVPEGIGSCSLIVTTDMLNGETFEVKLQ